MLKPRKDVTDVTLGQRIQELRKLNGLSQEALGEVLGVTRQAISKWESDLAVPEVDKLIAMSKRFAVPVGVLLGVEEGSGAEQDAVGGEELSERELQAVETIVSRYLAQAEQRRRPRRKWPLVLGGAVLFFAVFHIFFRLDQLDSRVGGLQGQVSNVNSMMHSQIAALAGQVEDILQRQNSLVADWSWELESVDPQQDSLTLAVNVTPRQYPEGLEVWVEAQAGGQTFTAQAQHRAGSNFLAYVPVKRALAEEVKLSAILVSGEDRQTQVLEELYGCRSGTYLTTYANYLGSMYLKQAKNDGVNSEPAALEWDGTVDLTIEPQGEKELPLQPERAEVRIYKNRELMECWPVDLSGWTEDQGLASYAGESALEPGKLQYRLEGIQAGDQIRLTFFVVDDFGQKTEFVMDAFELSADEYGRLDPKKDLGESHSQLVPPFGT